MEFVHLYSISGTNMAPRGIMPDNYQRRVTLLQRKTYLKKAIHLYPMTGNDV
jgi:hypothetical protein